MRRALEIAGRLILESSSRLVDAKKRTLAADPAACDRDPWPALDVVMHRARVS
jgi:hypothetical protein